MRATKMDFVWRQYPLNSTFLRFHFYQQRGWNLDKIRLTPHTTCCPAKPQALPFSGAVSHWLGLQEPLRSPLAGLEMQSNPIYSCQTHSQKVFVGDGELCLGRWTMRLGQPCRGSWGWGLTDAWGIANSIHQVPLLSYPSLPWGEFPQSPSES